MVGLHADDSRRPCHKKLGAGSSGRERVEVGEDMRPVVLVVNDDNAGRYATTEMLKSNGFDVLEAATGAAALAGAKQSPDLILLDVVLPDINGFDVCAILKRDERTRNIPVLHLSATAVDVGSRVIGLQGGADGYLVQPVESVELVATINALLRVRKAEAEALRLVKEKEEVIARLETALRHVKQLSGLLPICMHCKKIRNDKGYWEQMEAYISDHTDALFNHCLCEECAKRYYSDFA